MKYNFILNPFAGSGKSIEAMDKIKDYLDSKDIAYSIYSTEYPGHATEIAKKLVEEDVKNIISVGGDGTISEILNGIPENSNVIIGIIPAGTGNDYARSSGLELDTIQAMRKILKCNVKKVDYIEVETPNASRSYEGKNGVVKVKHCDKHKMICFGCAGIDGMIVQVVNNCKHKNKNSYFHAMIKTLFNYKWYNYDIKINGELKQYQGVQVAVLNGGNISTGLKICPLAEIDDGLMDIVIIKSTKRNWQVFSIFKDLIKGNILNNKNVEFYQVKEADIKLLNHKTIDIDGEIYKGNRMKCSVKPHAINLYM